MKLCVLEGEYKKSDRWIPSALVWCVCSQCLFSSSAVLWNTCSAALLLEQQRNNNSNTPRPQGPAVPAVSYWGTKIYQTQHNTEIHHLSFSSSPLTYRYAHFPRLMKLEKKYRQWRIDQTENINYLQLILRLLSWWVNSLCLSGKLITITTLHRSFSRNTVYNKYKKHKTAYAFSSSVCTADQICDWR